MRVVSVILTLLFLLTGSGAAGYLHEAHEVRVEVRATADERVQQSHAEHDAAHCAVCAAIAAAHASTPLTPDVGAILDQLLARRLAIDGERPRAVAPERRSCRDPPEIA